jgi:glycosyltransferase involved in cell wall biosynthesis
MSTNENLFTSARKLITVIIPVFNEELNVVAAYGAVTKVFEKVGNQYQLELIFSDNHSSDGTFNKLKTLAAEHDHVKVLRYNRNYGFQRSLMTAYQHASGSAAIQIDCDLQDPPELILDFLTLWEKGHDVVVGLRRHRQESKLLSWARGFFYRFINAISEDRLTPDAGDFRLVDRKIINQLRLVNHSSPYVRGMISSLAVNEAGIVYDRNTRQHEQSKFPIRKLVAFAMNGVVAHSVLPLRIAAYTGILVSLLTCLLTGFYVLSAIFFGTDWPRGFATTTILILFGIGLNGIFMGILGEYVARIYFQVHQRPLTVIEQTLNFADMERRT